jgi:DNA-binding CsgD family transcriptional regulator
MPSSSFSPQQNEKAELISRGLTNREIADAPGLSVRTMEAHSFRAGSKASINNRIELADVIRQFGRPNTASWRSARTESTPTSPPIRTWSAPASRTASPWRSPMNASLKLLDIISVGVRSTYRHSVTEQHNFSENMNITVPAGSTVAVYAMTPVTRVYGDFTITFGNTTMTVKDVYFDTPDANGAVRHVVQQCKGSSGSCAVPQSLLDQWSKSAGVDPSTPA